MDEFRTSSDILCFVLFFISFCLDEHCRLITADHGKCILSGIKFIIEIAALNDPNPQTFSPQIGPGSSVSGPVYKPQTMASPDNVDDATPVPLTQIEPEYLRGHIPAGHIPKPVVIADYVA